MATPLSLLKSFVDGQGGGIGSYTTYPADHDSNYGDIETTVNQLVSEVAAARVLDTLLPIDLAVSDDIVDNFSSIGRMAPWEVKVSRSGATLTITSGRLIVNGTRVDVTGTTFSAVRANGLYYIASDQSGLLAISSSASSAFVDICSVTVASNLWTSPNTDLIGVSQRIPLISANTTNRIYQRDDFTGGNVGNNDPAIRCVNSDGVLEDAGFSHSGTPSQFYWISQNDGGEATGSPVIAAGFEPTGQLSLREQARFSLIATAAHSIPENGTSSNNDVRWDTLPATNVAGALERFEPESYAASTDFQGATGNVNCIIPSGYGGTWMISAWFEIDELTGGTFIEARLFQNGGTSTGSFAEVRHAIAPTGSTKVCISGMLEAAGGDTFQLEVTHDATTAENILDGGLTAFRLGGVV